MSTFNVLCCSGHDPTGGAGIQADIEAVAAQGGHALSLITALTVQDTRNVARTVAVDADLLVEQLALLKADTRLAAIKLGLLGGIEQLDCLELLLRQAAVPVVMDPILRAGGGAELISAPFAAALKARLFPYCTVLTPNAAEARRWSGQQALDAAGQYLLDCGTQHVLITGGDEPDAQARNRWYAQGERVVLFEYPRLSGTFHGAGCTLAAALAARLALGESILAALTAAQAYAHQALAAARAVGQGRLLPRRLRSMSS